MQVVNPKKGTKKKEKNRKNIGMVLLPFVKRVIEGIARVMKSFIAAAARSQNNTMSKMNLLTQDK